MPAFRRFFSEVIGALRGALSRPVLCNDQRALGQGAAGVPAAISIQSVGSDPHEHVPAKWLVIIGGHSLSPNEGKIFERFEAFPVLTTGRGLRAVERAAGRNGRATGPRFERARGTAVKPKYQEKERSRSQASMVPRWPRMLRVSRRSRTTSCWIALAAAALVSLPGCAPRAPSSRSTVNRSSDFQLSANESYSHRGWLGVRVDTAPTGQGVLVSGTVPRSPAASAGIRTGDVLTAADGRPLSGPADFVKLIHGREPGTTLRLEGARGAERVSFLVKVEGSPDENGVLERILVGQPAPVLEGLEPLAEAAVPSWAALRGHVVVLDFWAPWCGVCHLVGAELNRWQERFGGKLTILGIAAGPLSEVAPHAPRFHMQYPLFADPEERVVNAYEAFAVPLVLVIDATGVVRAVTLGYSSQRLSKMETLIEKLLVSP